jgi:hypothetical protein
MFAMLLLLPQERRKGDFFRLHAVLFSNLRIGHPLISICFVQISLSTFFSHSCSSSSFVLIESLQVFLALIIDALVLYDPGLVSELASLVFRAPIMTGSELLCAILAGRYAAIHEQIVFI